jgi:thiol:disulfide interchange protein DsbD
MKRARSYPGNEISWFLIGSLLGLFVLACLAPRAVAQAQDDPFAETPKQNAKTSGKKPFANAPGSEKPKNPTDDRIDFEVSVKPQEAKRGETAKLIIKGIPRPGFHTYPMTQRADNQFQDELPLSKLIFENTPGLQPLWPISESDPETKEEQGIGYFLEHENPFTWSQDILILPDAKPGPNVLKFRIRLQVCDKTCVWGEHPFEVTIKVSPGPAVPLTPEFKERIGLPKPAIKVVSVPPVSGGENVVVPSQPPVANPSSPAGNEKSSPSQPVNPATDSPKVVSPESSNDGLLAFILQGIMWGAISLVTPCVFPMIPITVSFFLKETEKKEHRPLMKAAVYSGTIIVVLTLGGVLMAKGLRDVSQWPATNFILGGLFVFFALSLFGMYEIQLPSWLSRYTSSQEGRGGIAGTIFMALTFTIISFTCVAPFFGGFILLASSAQSSTDWVKLFLGALAYATTFAAPFFVLALFPTLIRAMPKSGSWMNTIKVVMGFIEMAAALKFLRAAELLWFGRAEILTYDLVLGMYVALSLLCGLYLLNLFRLPHDYDTPQQLGVPRLVFSLLFLSLAFYLTPALFKGSGGEQQRPRGRVFAWLDSFLLPDPVDESALADSTNGSSKSPTSGRLAWLGNLDDGLQKAKENDKLVFIDFTGLS